MGLKAPTKAERMFWEALRVLGCIVRGPGCEGATQIHHCGTGGGGGKKHRFVIPLCYGHHVGRAGIHTIGRRTWQAKHGTELELHQKAEALLYAP
jgi:hypothetical protein